MAQNSDYEDAAFHFDKREDLEEWLKTQPREVAIAVAARAALRVAPLVALAIPTLRNTIPGRPSRFVPIVARAGPSSADIERQQQFELLTSAVLHAAALAQITAKYATRAEEFRVVSHAEKLMESLVRAEAVNFGTAPQFVTDSVFGMLRTFGRDFDSFAASTVRDAAHAAAAAADDAAADIWTAASQDAVFIGNGGSASELVSQRLWPNGTPSWAENAWITLRSSLPANDNWRVWLNWYEFVLRVGLKINTLIMRF